MLCCIKAYVFCFHPFISVRWCRVNSVLLPIRTFIQPVVSCACRCVFHRACTRTYQREYAKSLPFNSDAKSAIAKQNELLKEMIQEVQGDERRK